MPLALLGALTAFGAPEASATTVGFDPIDLVDTVPGEDRWLYRYTIVGFDPAEAAGISIAFDFVDTADLDVDGVASPPAAWDVLVLQPDPVIPADGLFDAFALAAPASPSGPLEVSFVWSGAGVPGAQPFVVYDEVFATIETGTTTLVPEPSTALLVAVGLAGLASRRRFYVA